MPAAFARELLGTRVSRTKSGEERVNPNTSDNNDDLSVELGFALMDALGVPRTNPGPPKPDEKMVRWTAAELQAVRPDLDIGSAPATSFVQYEHLGHFRKFVRDRYKWKDALQPVRNSIEGLDDGRTKSKLQQSLRLSEAILRKQASEIDALETLMPEESILKPDITVASTVPQSRSGQPYLAIAVSGKWSLRTDRAQDVVSQGSKLMSLRRGRMPHFAVITVEPRPAMLKLLADGSGAIDCIYHLDLDALGRALDACQATRPNRLRWEPKRTFDRLVLQGRLRDYSDLIEEVRRLPA